MDTLNSYADNLFIIHPDRQHRIPVYYSAGIPYVKFNELPVNDQEWIEEWIDNESYNAYIEVPGCMHTCIYASVYRQYLSESITEDMVESCPECGSTVGSYIPDGKCQQENLRFLVKSE